MDNAEVVAEYVRACVQRLAAGRVRLPQELKAVARELTWAAELRERQRRVREWRCAAESRGPGCHPDRQDT